MVWRGGSGGTERVAAAAQRGWRRQHREGGSGGMERLVAVAHRGWVDGVGGVSVGRQHIGAVRYILWEGSGTRMGSVCVPGVSSCVGACRGGVGTAGACWRAGAVWGMGEARGGL